jgi:hypothetical protein
VPARTRRRRFCPPMRPWKTHSLRCPLLRLLVERREKGAIPAPLRNERSVSFEQALLLLHLGDLFLVHKLDPEMKWPEGAVATILPRPDFTLGRDTAGAP